MASISTSSSTKADLFQNYKEQSKNLAGQIAFLKMQSTRFAGDIADDAVNIFGGRGLTKTG
jgi:alkylation response protein AidB-like acyl-CoA dehydrogenase